MNMNRLCMAIRILAVLGFGAGGLMLAAPVSNTQRLDFPPGGTLKVTKSFGVLTVEAWDRPDLEITTISSAQGVRVAAERHGDEVVVSTDLPRHRAFSGFDLEYRIKAPRTAKLIAAHGSGEVNIDGLAGDIQVTLLQGEIMLHLPQEGRYNIDAQSRLGNVNSDFPGPEKRRWWLLGHRSVNKDAQSTHTLNLRVGFGDIVILKTRVPAKGSEL
jgi:hypothetical protein